MLIMLYIITLLHVVAGGVISAGFLRPESRTEHLLKAGLCAFVSFYLLPISMGWATGYMNAAVLYVAVAVAVGLAGLVAVKGERSAWQLWRWSAIREYKPKSEILIVAITAIWLGLVFLAGAALPVRTYDAPAYHMYNPMRWHMDGRFVLDSFGETETHKQLLSGECQPNVKAVLPFAIMTFTQDDKGTALTQFPFLVLVAVVARALAVRLGARGWMASLAAFGAVTAPETLFQATEAYTDLVFMTGQIAMVWALVHLWQTKLTWRSMVVAAIAFSMMAGAKSAFVASGGVLTLLYCVLVVAKLGLRDWKAWMRWIAMSGVVFFCGLAASGGAWLSHAWAKFHNPLYPFQVAVGEKVIFEGDFRFNVNDVMVKSFTGEEGWPAYWNTVRDVWRYPNLSSWSAGLGAGFLCVGAASLVFLLVLAFARSPHAGGRRIFLAGFVLLFLACPTPAVSRFSLFQPVMGYIACAAVVTCFPLLMRILTGAFVITIGLYDISIFTSAVQYRQRPPHMMAFHLLSGYTAAAMKDALPDQYTALDFWREEISGEGTNLAVPAGFSVWLAYSPQSPGGITRVRDPRHRGEMQAWFDEMEQAGITHIYLRKTDKAYEYMPQWARRARVVISRTDEHLAKHYGHIWLDPWPEDVLFELVSKN